ncbi:MAG: flippase-like domain-containing protein, partial [candidate division Zixibacteria bacterium]|nr:flippase-like domain-containing protein [candidate division Zixibacteria bacterium]
VMPVLTGQVGRLFLFARKEGLRKTFVFSTIVLEVLFDALTLVIFLLLTSLAFVVPDSYRSAGIVIAVVTVTVLILFYMMLQFQGRLEDVGRRRLRNRWPSLYVGVLKFMRSFAKGIETLRSSQHFFGTFGYSLASWTAHTLVIYFLFKSFGLELPFAAAATVMIVNTLALMIPVTPGNAGTFEVAVSTSLSAFAVGRSDAVLFAVALHILDLLPVFAFGLSFLHMERLSIREIKLQHEDDMILDRVSENGTLIESEEKV